LPQLLAAGNENNAAATAAKKRFEMLKTSNHHKRSRTVKAAINFLLTALGPGSLEPVNLRAEPTQNFLLRPESHVMLVSRATSSHETRRSNTPHYSQVSRSSEARSLASCQRVV
jgi:hypothetical protein